MVADSSAVQPKTKMIGAATSISSVNGATAGACSSDRSIASSLRLREIPGNMRNHELLRVEKDSPSCHYSCRPPRPIQRSAQRSHFSPGPEKPTPLPQWQKGNRVSSSQTCRFEAKQSFFFHALPPSIHELSSNSNMTHHIKYEKPFLFFCAVHQMPCPRFRSSTIKKRCRSNSIVNPNRKLCPCPGRRT